MSAGRNVRCGRSNDSRTNQGLTEMQQVQDFLVLKQFNYLYTMMVMVLSKLISPGTSVYSECLLLHRHHHHHLGQGCLIMVGNFARALTLSPHHYSVLDS